MLRSFAVGAVILALVGGFMALDRTVGHWYVPDLANLERAVESNQSELKSLSRQVISIRSDVGVPPDDAPPLWDTLVGVGSRLDRVDRCLRRGLSVYVYEINRYGEGYGETEPCR